MDWSRCDDIEYCSKFDNIIVQSGIRRNTKFYIDFIAFEMAGKIFFRDYKGISEAHCNISFDTLYRPQNVNLNFFKIKP